MAKKTPAPSGFGISRNKKKFTLTWKINAKNSNDGQQVVWRWHGPNSWSSWSKAKSIGKKATSWSVEVDKSTMTAVEIKVRDNQDKKGKSVKDLAVSKWAGKEFKLYTPPKSICSLTLNSNNWNACDLSWGHDGSAFSNSDGYWYQFTEYSTTFHSEKEGDSWSTPARASETGSSFVRENSHTLSDGLAYVRKYAFRIRGKAGYNSWAYCWHYYSTPYPAVIKSATISQNDYGGMNCSLEWNSNNDTFHPIDSTFVQYGIAVPGPNMSCPSDISWTERPSMADNPNGDDGDNFAIDSIIGFDQCLFTRVVNQHDNNRSYSVPALATGIATKLSVPVDFGINDVDFETYRLTIGVTNDSDVPDSNIAIVYRAITDGKATEQIIAIVPHGVESMTIQCPNFDIPDEWSLGAFAFVGDYGVYALTSDTEIVPEKKYFTRTGNEEQTATPIESPSGNPHDQGYYEKLDDLYFITDDTYVKEEKTYYTLSAFVPYEYTLVESPVVEDLGLYYELVPNASTDVTYTAGSFTLTYSVYEIPYIKMRSVTTWQGGDIPRAPSKVMAVSPREGVALVTWDWAWKSADIAEISWSNHDDAWESTDQPEVYRITNAHAAKWSIYGLETGVTWYIRVRLIKLTSGGENPGPWSSIDTNSSLDMASAPNAPILTCSKRSVTHDDSFTISWEYKSTDGTDQKDAVLVSVSLSNSGEIIYGQEILTNIGTSRSVDLIPDNIQGWESGNKYGFALKVISESEKHSEWSDPEFIAIAEPLVCSIVSDSFVKRELFVSAATDSEIVLGSEYHSLTGTAVESPDVIDLPIYYELSDGVYTLTEDGAIDETKTYYTVTSSGVFSVNPVSNPVTADILTYYEFINGVYTKTEDVEVDPNKIYYTVSGSTAQTISGLDGYYNKAELNILKKMPIELSASVSGGLDNTYHTIVSIERATSYFVERPDETTYSGYEGETVYSDDAENPSAIRIEQSSLIGYLDDTAGYILTVRVYDELDQVAEDSILFFVSWEHQASIPGAIVEFDPEYSVMKITPTIDQTKYEEGDTFDIYRLSVDKPTLIVKGGTFGQTYVDPFPTIGRFGGHRVVTITANGDFISNDEDDDMAWIDLDEEDGDIFETEFPIINYGEGTYEILYNVDLSTQWNKDFRETRYLGGHIQGDWNAGVSRTATINSVTLRDTDEDTIRAFRRLAEYEGLCHIRTLDGSNYYADVQVSETIPSDDNPLNTYSFNVTRVDSDGYDGIELSEWNKLISG